MDTEEITSLAELSEAEVVELLATEEVGRLVYTRRALPEVTPVNYALRDGAIWVWTASTSSMAQAVRGAVVAFEVDRLDHSTHTGWSATVLGVAELVTDEKLVERARLRGPEPWVPARKEHLIRVPLKMVSGRRIVSAPAQGPTERPSGASAVAKTVP
jgi:nitroimidazol reductase NimA-like FMN-containing flavoprotein (pyridoxamine 5'-phosphate oxidase superfamily)